MLYPMVCHAVKTMREDKIVSGKFMVGFSYPEIFEKRALSSQKTIDFSEIMRLNTCVTAYRKGSPIKAAGRIRGKKMLFTRGADYALRGMIYLAQQPRDKLSMASEIAASEEMPEYFFSKVFQNLAKSGLINSFRGSNGGFALAKSPAEITIREVIESLEGPITISKCVNSPEVCDRSGTCPLHLWWKEAQDNLVSMLDNRTLADAVAHLNNGE